MKKLVRFRADPEKVRVSIRRMGWQGWRVTVELRRANPHFGKCVCIDKDLNAAMRCALQDASDMFKRFKVKGLDLDMQQAYEHPWLEEDRVPYTFGPSYVYPELRKDKKEF